MSKLKRDEVLFIWRGMADATESFLDMDETDSWRDAVVLTERETGGRLWVCLEAADEEARMLAAAASSLVGVRRVEC
jgi:hypothetical protein